METINDTKYEAELMPIDVLCDSCQAEITVGETAFIDKQNGTVHCQKCAEAGK